MIRTELGVPAEQRTIVTAQGIEAIPGMPVCDFCTSTPVVFSYPCGRVVIQLPGTTLVTDDPWGACEHCHALIEADDPAGVQQRALWSYIASEGELPEGVLVEIRQMFAGIVGAFFEGREGDPVAV